MCSMRGMFDVTERNKNGAKNQLWHDHQMANVSMMCQMSMNLS